MHCKPIPYLPHPAPPLHRLRNTPPLHHNPRPPFPHRSNTPLPPCCSSKPNPGAPLHLLPPAPIQHSGSTHLSSTLSSLSQRKPPPRQHLPPVQPWYTATHQPWHATFHSPLFPFLKINLLLIYLGPNVSILMLLFWWIIQPVMCE